MGLAVTLLEVLKAPVEYLQMSLSSKDDLVIQDNPQSSLGSI